MNPFLMGLFKMLQGANQQRDANAGVEQQLLANGYQQEEQQGPQGLVGVLQQLMAPQRTDISNFTPPPQLLQGVGGPGGLARIGDHGRGDLEMLQDPVTKPTDDWVQVNGEDIENGIPGAIYIRNTKDGTLRQVSKPNAAKTPGKKFTPGTKEVGGRTLQGQYDSDGRWYEDSTQEEAVEPDPQLLSDIDRAILSIESVKEVVDAADRPDKEAQLQQLDEQLDLLLRAKHNLTREKLNLPTADEDAASAAAKIGGMAGDEDSSAILELLRGVNETLTAISKKAGITADTPNFEMPQH